MVILRRIVNWLKSAKGWLRFARVLQSPLISSRDNSRCVQLHHKWVEYSETRRCELPFFEIGQKGPMKIPRDWQPKWCAPFEKDEIPATERREMLLFIQQQLRTRGIRVDIDSD
ncbi:MAG: hypothetical protein JNL62_19150 [Bryobacterales bacterium]|nr:hypothetical protein [Bryobacterales bacterium]